MKVKFYLTLVRGGTHLYLGSLLNRKVVGSELNEEYFEIIKNRFKGGN